MDVAIHWRGSVTDFATDLIQGALARRDLVALVAELERRGYGVPRGIPWVDGGEDPEPEVCPPCSEAGFGVVRCGKCAGCRAVLEHVSTTGNAGAPTESSAPATIRQVGPSFSAGHSVIRKLLNAYANTGGLEEQRSITRLEHGTATAADLERLAPIARDAGLPWEKLFTTEERSLHVAGGIADLPPRRGSGELGVEREEIRRRREDWERSQPGGSVPKPPPNPITSVAARDFTLAGPCPELCGCDESQWLRGRLRSVSRKALQVHELARGGADAEPGGRAEDRGPRKPAGSGQ